MKLLRYLMPLAFIPFVASAEVFVKNGNYSISFIDLSYPGGIEPKIERVYNSTTAFRGIFGEGWGTEYEKYLTTQADGSVIVHEYGGGDNLIFRTLKWNPQELDQAIEMITAAQIKIGAIGSKEALASYKRRLRDDVDFRSEEWEKHRAAKRLKPRELPPGTQLISTKFDYQYITKTKSGYIRSFFGSNGRTENFDELGKLTQISDRSGHLIRFTYGKNQRLEEIVDESGRKFHFILNPKGLVEKIRKDSGEEANYRYNAIDELIQCKIGSGKIYSFQYSDPARREHNLTQITYPDHTAEVMTYSESEKDGRIRSLRDRSGNLNLYEYQKDPADPAHLISTVTAKDLNNKTFASHRYDYFLKFKPNGEEWTYRYIQSINGKTTEKIYNECCELPVIIKKDGAETKFEYDVRARLTHIKDSFIGEFRIDYAKDGTPSLVPVPQGKEKVARLQDLLKPLGLEISLPVSRP
jgi:YD repeat-containing protein